MDTSGTIRLDVRRTTDAAAALRADAARGLTARPKELPPTWFYDARGSRLFERITALPEYYPFRTEQALLAASAGEIARSSGADTIAELGSGSSTKTRLLLDAFGAAGTLRRYVPLDVSESALRGALDGLHHDRPGLELHGVVGDFTHDLHRLPGAVPGGRRMLAFLGGTIGNLLPGPRHEFLTRARAVLAPGEQLLLGTGLVTDPAVMLAAYDDAAGVTAAFNRNVLHVLNRELRADFVPDEFAHVALWDPECERIEMRLRARRTMRARIAALGLEIEFDAGEELHTEVSAKFRPEVIDSFAAAAGFAPVRRWTDPDRRFALSLLTAR